MAGDKPFCSAKLGIAPNAFVAGQLLESKRQIRS